MLATRPLLALNLARTAPFSRVGLRAASSSFARMPTTMINPSFTRNAATSTHAQTTKLSQQQNLELLNQQRAQRPSSPHFTIYQPQITWYLSIINRITGSGLSVLMYAYFSAYAGYPLFAGSAEALSSGSLTDFVATLPAWFKTAVKFPLALAFTFHSFNGLRHLAWDWGYALTLKGVYSTAYVVMGATAISTLALLFV
ncbi:related to SDH3 - cytochrome b560 subunit of respiratory complex II [Melanopsichium pennsylvanicum]|uniref:Related to SDH3 - cytochrome b560 subunit of respiratory complex II n=2 Tax=Melanopsichium pennsylvanicum TaxID=63383 RepID=A0AAJ4XPT7_9BASI|nr:related to SDH3-cytochrome b560 subunit of respiratory complex II [Melanopsichium pennsylvanicum 4]SNX85731.1 related to SDH3 - cytochrome b560 subunit of respiratory complex II [Melanopsichium pennsylvanicum]